MNKNPKIGWRTQLPIYSSAFFLGNLFPISHVIVPLWVALELKASLLIIGIVIASRQVLPVAFSIYGGALLDRFGPRNIILLLGTIGIVSTIIFPFYPIIWVTIVLQMIIGFCETTNWIGIQSTVGTLMRSEAKYAGRLTAAARFGGFLGPVAIGIIYESFGAVGGFLAFGIWAFFGVACAAFLPPIQRNGTSGSICISASADIRLRVSDYRETFRLLVVPAIVLVVAATFMRQAGSGVQASFYGIWLKEIGYTAGFIGVLIGISNGFSALSALTIGPLVRHIIDYWLLIFTVGLAILGIAVTPMFESGLLLAFAISLRGIGQGLNLPLMISIASRSVPAGLQGRAAALRITFNRFGSLCFPVIMGLVAEIIGLEIAFYVVGGSGVLCLILLAFWLCSVGPKIGEK